MKKVVIYGKLQCNHCDSAKRFLEMKGIPHDYKQLDRDFTREDLLALVPNARSYPQIFVDGVSVGGFDQLTKLDLS